MKYKTFSLLLIGLVVALTAGSLALFFFGPPQIPLWYSLSVADQQLTTKTVVFLFPISTAAVGLVSMSAARAVRSIDSVLPKLFLSASLIPLAVLSLAYIHMLFLVL